MIGNKALSYISTEREPAIKELQMEVNGTGKKNKRNKLKSGTNNITEESIIASSENNRKNQEEFEAMKKKTKKLLLACIGVIAAAVAGLVAYKYMQ